VAGPLVTRLPRAARLALRAENSNCSRRQREVAKAGDRRQAAGALALGAGCVMLNGMDHEFQPHVVFYQLILMVCVFLKTMAACVAPAAAQSAATIIGHLARVPDCHPGG
jgi:hypothetical protein